MNDNEIHDLALTSAKYFIENKMGKYSNNSNGQALLVSDLLTQYFTDKHQIQDTLSKLK